MPLVEAEQDADGTFWYYDAAGNRQQCPPRGAQSSNGAGAGPQVVSPEKKHWVEIAMVDKEGNPCAGQDYEIKLPDGSLVTGSLNEQGAARVEGIDPGQLQDPVPESRQDGLETEVIA